MTQYEERLRVLLHLFADNKATEQEIREMLGFLRQKEGHKELQNFMMQLQKEHVSVMAGDAVDWEKMWSMIQLSNVKSETPVRKMKWIRVAAAAVILICSSMLFLTRSRENKVVKTDAVPQQKADVMPGSDKAILTLASGAKIALDDSENGVITQQGNTKLIKVGNGQLMYETAGGREAAVLYNTVNTPRGGQYNLILPDGSKVWLNAVSSIRFPTAFSGNERTVEITGECYFEVAKHSGIPFKVLVNTSESDKMEVSVLGTHFNINAYSDESTIKTTLLEGRVRVSKGTKNFIIKPGQQTQLDESGVIKVIPDANMEEAVAWKEGRFEFKDTDLKTIMRQIMRWYDVDVEYQGNISDRYFTADISRDKTLSGVLKILKQSDIDFKLEGKKLVVAP